MEKQENQGKTPENEEKKNHDYTQLRECIDDAEKRGLSFFFVAADDEHMIQVADCKKRRPRPCDCLCNDQRTVVAKVIHGSLGFQYFHG